MMIVSCLPITRKYGGIAFLSLVARMTLMIFFLNDADLYADELLGKTYCWVTAEIPHRIVALFTLSNDSIKTRLISPNDKNRLQRNIVNPKRGRSYPAVLIGRLGVNREYQGTSSHVGRQLMAFIKD